MTDDNWRFADDVVKKVSKELGAYGGDVTPGVMTKTVTGVARGEELFARPELHRPWRTPSSQRHAEVVVAKEQEIEVLTRKLTELRSQVATANREMQRMQNAHRIELQSVVDAKEKVIDDLTRQLSERQKQMEEVKLNNEMQIKALKSQHDKLVLDMQQKLKQTTESATELSTVYMKQIEDIKSAAAREVELIQQLCNSRTAELSDELKTANETLRKFQDRSLASIAELQGEMRRNEVRLMDQLREQEKRFEAMRSTLQGERQVVEIQRDKVSGEKTDNAEKLRAVSEDLHNTEQRFRDWNSRIVSDLDQIYDYYSAMIREVEAQAPAATTGVIPQQRVTDVYIPPRLAGEPVSRVTMDRIVERLAQLMLMKQSHASASQALLRKIRNMESSTTTTAEQNARASEEKELQLTRLLTEVVESRGRQERLEKALAETQLQFSDLESRLSAANIRLQFFNDDLASALSSPSATVAAPVKDVTFALLSVEGGNLLWESDPQAASSALMMMNNAIRSKMAQYGAYECFSDGTTMMLAFHDPVAACRFALEAQVWLMELPWPAAIASHYNTCEEYKTDEKGNRFLVFRGLRVAMALHSGEVEMEPTGLPVGVGESRVHYFGRTIIQALHLVSLAVGGQIVVSNAVWVRVKDRSGDLGSPQVTDLGDHRLTVAMRGGADGPSTSEVLTLVQLVPQQLKARSFDRQSMFDARRHLTGGSADGGSGGAPPIAPQLSHIRRSTLTDEVVALKSRQVVVSKAMETLQDETTAISTVIEALAVKLRDAKIGAHVFSPADLQAQASTVDRLITKLDAVKSDVARVTKSSEELQSKSKSLEDTLSLHARITMSEDDFRRRIEIANERCNQQLFEASQSHEAKMQQLRAMLSKVEHENAELRRQLISAPPHPLQHMGTNVAPTPSGAAAQQHHHYHSASARGSAAATAGATHKAVPVTKRSNSSSSKPVRSPNAPSSTTTSRKA